MDKPDEHEARTLNHNITFHYAIIERKFYELAEQKYL